MNDQTDSQLLRAYAENRSEAAFAELVRRHVDFVYSAARRMVVDPHLAEDVTQSVFVAFAKNARQLTERPVLSGWLHRTAQNIAAQTVRTIERRRAREQEAVALNELVAHEPDVTWENIAPHLDTALGELSEPDRDALLLRYFEKKSTREMAEVLNVSEEAAQKRVNRAVERLRELFSKRNVTIGASGLAVLISTNAVHAAPIGLFATISTAVSLAGTTLQTSIATSTLKLMSAATLKPIIIASASIAASIVIVVQHNRADRLREQNQSLHAQIQKAETAFAELSERPQRLPREGETDARQRELLRLRSEVSRLRGLEPELAKLREELLRQREQNRAVGAAKTAAQEVIQRFEARKGTSINTMKQVGLQLRALAAQNNVSTAFTVDGSLNPSLIVGVDLKNVELLVNDPDQLKKLLDEATETIVARTAEAISTPDGRWLRLYTFADGSVQSYSSDFAEQAFTGNLQIQNVKPQP